MVTLTIDCNGVYGATAYVIGGASQTGAATPILAKPVTLTAPPTASYEASLDPADIAPVSRLDSQQHAGQIIDADYEILGD
jgi:hypothetical protein